MKLRRLQAIEREISILFPSPKPIVNGFVDISDSELDYLLYTDAPNEESRRNMAGYPDILAAFMHPTPAERKAAFESLIDRDFSQVCEYLGIT